MTCGSAPISSDVMDFLKVAFACDVIEGMSDVNPPHSLVSRRCTVTCSLFLTLIYRRIASTRFQFASNDLLRPG